MDPITLAMGLAQFVPGLLKWVTGSDKAESVAQKAIDIAKTVTGKDTGEAALEELKVSPDKVLEYRRAVLDQAVEFDRLAVENATDVNKSMQAEAASEHWPTYTWRPFIGFAVGVNVFASSALVLIVFVPILWGNKDATAAVAQLPMVLGALAGINATVLPILGIASWYRGKMQADPTIPTINRG